MKSLAVYRELAGSFEEVGQVKVSPDYLEPVRFCYSSEFLVSPDASAISASLPLNEEPFDEQITDAFFDGLLSEGDVRVQVARALGVDAGDTTGLLAALNYDTIGALVFTEGSVPSYEGSAYEPLDLLVGGALWQSAAALAEYAVRTHASLSGYVNKLGVYRDSNSNWYAPIGLAPSNYIVKFSDSELPYDIENEMLCMLTAHKLGLPVAECTALGAGSKKEAQALAIRRFDRVQLGGRNISELSLYGRLHQEDFCQAFGFGSGLKYQHGQGAYFSRATRLLNAVSSQPAVDVNLLVDNLLVDYMLGNCDNHLKNYSLLYSADWKHIRLAPAYDKMCTLYYPRYATNMGIPLAEGLLHEELSDEGIAACMEVAGYSFAYVQRRLYGLAAKFDNALDEAWREVEDQGLVVPADLIDCIKRSAAFTQNAIG